MSGQLKIAGIITLIAAVIAATVFTSDKITNSKGEKDSMKTVGTVAATIPSKKENTMDQLGKQSNSIFKSNLIMPGVWEITDGTADSPAYVDIYLVEGTERALVIDAGLSGSDLEGYIKTLTDKPLELVLTHGHSDHVASVTQFDQVYMSSKDFDILRYMIHCNNFKDSGFKDLKGGEIFDLGGCKLEVLALPGHTQGSVVLLDRERQILFAGDAIGSGSLWLQLPESSSVEEFRDTIRNFEKNVEGLNNLKVCLGHSCLMGRKPDRNYITDTRITAEKIVSGEITGTPSGRTNFPGSVSASYDQMTEFLYRPEKILKAGR
jgi:hydroxyacylglutathione hydrolase